MTVPRLQAMKRDAQKIVAITAYDASFAVLVDEAGVDVVLVGDSLGMVIQGRDSTLPVSVDDMAYHTKAVARGLRKALLVADLPFMSYADSTRAYESAARLIGDAGASMLKLEGAGWAVDIIHALAARDVPVCAHLGLTPQSVHKLGGYRVQGRVEEQAQRLLADAHAVANAGADMLVLECVPANLATRITEEIGIPTIGIGAGPGCSGQVLVLYDLLGITPGKRPRFSRNFLAGRDSIGAAVSAYAASVRSGEFPAAEHSY
ncbi:MAG: 3-methyl-2-oxobutanoate hydroxymethyltransferase [Tahibacter sp.]